MRLAAPTLLLVASIVASLASGCGGGSDRPNVVLVFVDTLRPDRLPLYGGERPTTPHLDRVAARGAVFENALAPSPWTLPSAASMLTGLHPYRHGAGLHGDERNLDSQRPTQPVDGVRTIAELFGRAGYRTAAYASNPHLRRGLLQTFDDWSCRVTEGSVVAQQGIDALDELVADGPFFLMLHFMDVHDPLLVPNEDSFAITSEEDAERVMTAASRHFRSAKLMPPERFRDERLLAYDAAIHYVDRQLGRVLAALDERGVLDETLFAYTSDHGEELFEHLALAKQFGYEDPRGLYGLGHGHSLFHEQLWVPLVLWGPGVQPCRVAEQVTLMDLVPTLLDYAGVASPGDLDGRSLRPLIEGGTWEPEPLLAGSVAYGSDRRAWVTPEWKLVIGSSETEAPMLFDRIADPGERESVARKNQDVLDALRAQLLDAEDAMGRAQGEQVQLTAEDHADLEALGYAGEDG